MRTLFAAILVAGTATATGGTTAAAPAPAHIGYMVASYFTDDEFARGAGQGAGEAVGAVAGLHLGARIGAALGVAGGLPGMAIGFVVGGA